VEATGCKGGVKMGGVRVQTVYFIESNVLSTGKVGLGIDLWTLKSFPRGNGTPRIHTLWIVEISHAATVPAIV
jgi:hypothetical protein